jgi:hypothetical protein
MKKTYKLKNIQNKMPPTISSFFNQYKKN